jgi:hypothetical protein
MDINKQFNNLHDLTLKEIENIIESSKMSMRQVSFKFLGSETAIANILHRAKKDKPYKIINLLKLYEVLVNKK